MPKGVDEAVWKRAKAKVEEQHGSAEGRYALVMHIYKQMLKGKEGDMDKSLEQWADERLEKGRGLPPGTTRRRKDGEYVKQGDGKWKRKGKGEAKRRAFKSLGGDYKVEVDWSHKRYGGAATVTLANGNSWQVGWNAPGGPMFIAHGYISQYQKELESDLKAAVQAHLKELKPHAKATSLSDWADEVLSKASHYGASYGNPHGEAIDAETMACIIECIEQIGAEAFRLMVRARMKPHTAPPHEQAGENTEAGALSNPNGSMMGV